MGIKAFPTITRRTLVPQGRLPKLASDDFYLTTEDFVVRPTGPTSTHIGQIRKAEAAQLRRKSAGSIHYYGPSPGLYTTHYQRDAQDKLTGEVACYHISGAFD